MISDNNGALNPNNKQTMLADSVKLLSDYVDQNFSVEEKANIKNPKYFYEVEFDKPGGMLMPIIVEFTYADDTKENFKFPAQIWRKSNETAKRFFATTKVIKKIQIDPKLETADIDITNNSWPKEVVKSKFD
jgi:hypothetical protein